VLPKNWLSFVRTIHAMINPPKMIGSWERGEHLPSLFYREKLIFLYGKSLRELGLIAVGDTRPERAEESLPLSHRLLPSVSEPHQQVSSIQLTPRQAIDLVCEAHQATHELQPGAWLALGASDLATLFEEGWSLEEVLTALHITLQGVQAMPYISRRTFGRRVRDLIVAAVVSGMPIPTGEHLSIEERIHLHQMLGATLASGWKLFHTAGTVQVLAVGQAQLLQVQEASAYLYSSVRPLYYSGVHRLIGAALHFQGRYEAAYHVQEKAYIAALEGADAWNMAQSRGWQAYGLKAREEYLEAMHAADAALRLVSWQEDTESIRLRARLLAFGAENAALLGQSGEVQRRLDASEELLEYLPGAHEEFDRTSWLQQAGTCALSLKHYDLATQRLQQALDELPAHWTLRSVSTAIPLASAFARQKERNRALAIAEQTVPVVQASQSLSLIREFKSFLQEDLLACFPSDRRCQTFVAEVQQQLALA
jgi:tetratricopeptide (TPR) repeat protein